VLSVSNISSTGHMTQLSLVLADDILHMFVSLHFPSNSLNKISEFIVFIFSCSVLDCFYSKIKNATTLQSRPGFLAHSVVKVSVKFKVSPFLVLYFWFVVFLFVLK